MDFALHDHQQQLLRAAAQWLERSWQPADVGRTAVRRQRWSELVANGWTALLSPEGEAPPVLDAALLVEALASGGCTLPVGPGAMVAPYLIELAGLSPAADGVDQLVVLDHRDGVAPPARGLELADRVVMLRAGPDDGTQRWSVAAVDVGDCTVTVVQDEVRTVLSSLVVPERVECRDIDPAAGQLAWNIGAVLAAAELVGLARAVLDDCVAYAKIRVQGGKAIGGHQAVQHRLADMLANVERSRYLTYLAATSVAAGATTAVHQAKALAVQDCLATIRSGHQVMGAIAYSAEHSLHHFHKQAVVAAHEFGNAEHHWSALETPWR